MDPELDLSQVEVANLPDPDLEPVMGKPVLKIFWNEQTKTPSIIFDHNQFPQMNFMSALLGMVKDDLDLKIRAIGETQIRAGLAEQTRQQQQAQQMANRLRNGK